MAKALDRVRADPNGAESIPYGCTGPFKRFFILRIAPIASPVASGGFWLSP